MPLLTSPEGIPRKSITFFLVVETSHAMHSNKLETVNRALENYIALLQYYAAARTDAEVKVALLGFSGKAHWFTEKPVKVDQYVWKPLTENTDNEPISFNNVFDELNNKLSKNAFMESVSGAYPPVIIFFSTSSCPLSPALDDSLTRLSGNNWDKNALKVAFAIGKTAEKDILERWTGIPSLALSVKNSQALLEYVNVAGRLCMQIAFNSGIYNDEIPGNTVLKRRAILKKSLEEILLLNESSVNLTAVMPDMPEEKSDIELSASEIQPHGISTIAVEYKNTISKEFVSLNPSHIDDRIGGKRFFITRKYDGELAVLSWNGNSLIAVNSSGKPFAGFLCIRETAGQLRKFGVKSLVFAAELYCEESKGRSRVSDYASAIAKKPDSLRLAPFDIISLNGKPCKSIKYNEIHGKLTGFFGENEYCKPVKYIEAGSKTEIKNIFAEWVEKEGSEGLIIRSELPIVHKLKPRVTVDAVVVGFSESSDTKGQVRTLLYALRNSEGKYQIIGRTGNGLTAEQKIELYLRLSKMKISSNYLEIDSNRLAFHMIRPELVIELSIGDIITEVTSGNIKNPILEYDNNAIKQTVICAGYSFISAVIERLREDKTNNINQVSLDQISEKNPVHAESKINTNEEMPKSLLLRRDVWTCGTSVQKLLVWKTNKEKFGFPAYCVSWTSFKPDTQDKFKVDMRISNSETQIKQLAGQFIGTNISSTWLKE